MAKSEYEYVREQERDDRLPKFNWIVVRINGCDFRSFIWRESTTFYERRESKILSLSLSFFTSVYVMKWRKFFPAQELTYPPSFDGQVICYPGPGGKLVRDYLLLRQYYCHINNQKNTCLWMLVKSGKTEREAEIYLEGTQESEMNELLFQQFGINYNNLPPIFRKGSSVFTEKVEEIVKVDESGNPIKRMRKKTKVDHCDLTRKGFWKDHSDTFPD